MRATWTVAALCAFTLVPLRAQEVSSTKEWIRKEVEEQQRRMREGKLVRGNVRITVRLRNGSRMRGVVKHGRFIERHDGLAFISSDRTSEGAGLRLWYYDQTNSYVFLPWETIAEHSIGEVLTDDEVARMGLELERSAQKTRDQAAKLLADVKASAESKGGATTPPGAGKPPVATPPADEPATVLTAEQQALLAEFPPAEGWGADKRQQLEARKIQVGVFPNAHEKRFLDNFAAWAEAYALQKAQEDQQNGAGVTPVVVSTTPVGSKPAPAGTGQTPPPTGGQTTPPPDTRRR